MALAAYALVLASSIIAVLAQSNLIMNSFMVRIFADTLNRVPAFSTPSTLQMADIAIKASSVGVAALSIILVYRQIVKTHEWNRRKASQDFAFELVSGPRSVIVQNES